MAILRLELVPFQIGGGHLGWSGRQSHTVRQKRAVLWGWLQKHGQPCVRHFGNLVTKTIVPGKSVCGEKSMGVLEGEIKLEYCAWNLSHFMLVVVISGGVHVIQIKPGNKVTYFGVGSENVVSLVSDIVVPDGLI